MIRHFLLASSLALVTGTSAVAGLLHYPHNGAVYGGQPHHDRIASVSTPILISRIVGIVDLAENGRADVIVPDNGTPQGSATTGIRANRGAGAGNQLLGMNDSHGDDPRNPLPTRDHWSF